MKVLYFHQHFSTPSGSTGIRSYEMAKKLIEHGHDVTMVCGSYGGGETGLATEFRNGRREGLVDNIYIIEFDLAYSNKDGFLKRSMTFLKFAFKSIGISLTHDYDVVFATSTPLTAGIPGIAARWLRKKRFVFEVRDLWPELPREMGVITNPVVLKLMSILEWSSYRSAHACVGLSPGIVKGIHSRGIKDEAIEMIPNGCDLGIFSSGSERKWRPDSVSDSDFMAIFTGTHGIANGLDAVLKTAEVLKKRGREDIKLVLVGQGKLKPDLVHMAKDMSLDNVIFLDPVNKIKLTGLMASADLGMQILANVPAFYYGTSPNKFFDYISAGLPVLNNYPGWLADMILDENCGLVVPPDDPAAFADALESAASSPEVLFEMGENARQLAHKKFNRKELAEKWVEVVLP
ncbi:glycosyltransferase family 4 protein [Pleionea sp. CnH1-48]|uniref:glycosyltransferase family 4 protein n=1 Tax=Pleionea sp. CnH1-48 TaxID=2954494 RepID=UPI002096CB8A|nr:glycosyltransferase family 4 protein [Pleionea sp. CnH1-48]MCO7223787.1 glycosyltransferase family 4 protein [Pleionea sp. CnH1-48]